MSGQASSSTAAAPGAPHPRPQGRAPKEHTWDGSYGESGAWLHNVTGLPWAKGGRSAASMAQQRERKREDKRDRSGRPEASGAQKRKGDARHLSPGSTTVSKHLADRKPEHAL